MMSDFNINNNLKKLFIRPATGHFYCIDGLRAISILWLIGFHCLFFMIVFGPERYVDISHQMAGVFVKLGFYGVDIFFVISGFIISFSLMKEWQQHGSINIRKFYYRRILRLLPAYYTSMAVLVLYTTVNVDNIWANIIYVNNFITMNGQFMPWTWSLAVEEQFYIIFPFFLLFFLKFDRFRAALLSLLAVLAVYIRFCVAGHDGMSLSLQELNVDASMLSTPHFAAYFDMLYDKIYTRFGALLAGVIVAYIYLFTNVKADMEKGPLKYVLLAVSFILLVGLISVQVMASGSAFNAPELRVIIAIFPYVFSVSIAYILFFTLSGSGESSLLGRFLSLRIWYPISQVSYSAFLVNPMVIMLSYKAVLNHLPVPATSSVVINALLLTMLSLFIAGLLYLAIERPMMNMRHRYKA